MASDISEDPNPISNPGIPNFNLLDVFQSFGYQPTQAEINALIPSFEGKKNMGETGSSAIANYVFAMQQLAPAQQSVQGNLLSEQQAAANAQNLSQIYETQGQAAYSAAANIYTQAPQLFGSLTPAQIQQYIAPVTQATAQNESQIQTSLNQQGLGAGSSVEANALQQAQQQYQQQVLSTGLQVGQTQQQNQSQVLQQLAQALFGASNQQGGLGAQYSQLANTSAGQNAAIATDVAGLPSQSVNNSISQQAAIQALNPTSSTPWGSIASGLGTAAGAAIGSVIAPGAGTLVGAGLGGALGSGLGGAFGGGSNANNSIALGSNQLGNTALIASLLGNGGSGLGGNTPPTQIYTSGIANSPGTYE